MTTMSIQIVAMVCLLLCFVESKNPDCATVKCAPCEQRDKGSKCCGPCPANPKDCPTFDESWAAGIGVITCTSDTDCKGREKCCNTACMDTMIKPGACPKRKGDQVGICINQCTNDYNCTEEQKCCSNGCGNVCTDPRGSDCKDLQQFNQDSCTQCKCHKSQLNCFAYSCALCPPGSEPTYKKGQCCPDCQKVPEV